MIDSTSKSFMRALLACAMLMASCPMRAQTGDFSFGVIAHPFQLATGDAVLRNAIADTDADNLAFVIANGIKAGTETCTDAVYLRRKALLNSAKNGLIVSLAGSDWTECVGSRGDSIALERLNRLRELFFVDEFSFGSSRIPVMRQSSSAIFRSYSENMRWEIGNVMFATVNLPAPNNHYRTAAGRNSEFEDRLVANREWLARIFTSAKRKKMSGIVLFCDGDPLVQPGFRKRFGLNTKRDGFAETRKHLMRMAAKFGGKVLIIYSRTSAKVEDTGNIAWLGNLGKLQVRSGWAKLDVNHANPRLFRASTMTLAGAKASTE